MTELRSTALSTCGCEAAPVRPERPDNRPGLAALSYRIGTHATFLRALETALAGRPALRALTTRDASDPAIAVLDACATMADVLTFYQERIANEGFLRTATERRSILELARAIGYELKPGVAAGTYLTFVMDEAKGAPPVVTVEAGTKVQSVPGQDEKPQIFETVETIEARVAWNAITVKSTEAVVPSSGHVHLYLEGTDTRLQPGDPLIFVGQVRRQDPASEQWDLRRVRSIAVDVANNRTLVQLQEPMNFRMIPTADPQVFALRLRAALFGHNAPNWKAMPKNVRNVDLGRDDASTAAITETEWPKLTIAGVCDLTADQLEAEPQIHLDAAYPTITPKSWIALIHPTYTEIYRVESSAESARANFTLSTKTTHLKLSGENLRQKFNNHVRATMVYAQSERLVVAERPLTTPVTGTTIVLTAAVDPSLKGRAIEVAGRLTSDGTAHREVTRIVDLSPDRRTLFLSGLTGSYRPETVTINANVARATHGEGKFEVLGSADAARAFQRFVLKQKPVTYVGAANARGAESTLELRVNDVRWHERDTLHGAGPDDRIFVARRSDEGDVTVMFGDGVSGARPPSGQDNISARYRIGLGLAGRVKAGQLSLLLSRPPGLREARNALDAAGAADPEERDEARANAPLTVLTLDRVVSLRDYEDYARAFAGVGKAQATWLWDGETRFVHVTVAGAGGAPLPDGSDVHTDLAQSLDAAREPTRRVVVATYRRVNVFINAGVAVHPDHTKSVVHAAVTAALTDAFAFARRSFGQPVTKSEVLAVMQRVEGVVAADLNLLYAAPQSPSLNTVLVARGAYWDTTVRPPVARAAVLLLLATNGVTLTDMAP